MPDSEPKKHETLYARNGYMDVQKNFHISFRNAYLYAAIPKVANSTIKGLLQQQDLIGTSFTVDDIHNRLCSPLVAPFQLRPSHFEQILIGKGFFRFVFVRNPYSRLLSCYLDRVQALRSVPRRQVAELLQQPVEEDISFEMFVEAIKDVSATQMNEHFRPQSILVSNDIIEYDFIGRFENFAADMDHIVNRLWPKRSTRVDLKANLSPKNTSAGEKVTAHYTPALARTVAEVFADDFASFGYSTDLPG